MSKVCVFDHPLIQHKLSILRDKNTSVKEFRELISEIAMLMCYEATRDLPLEEVEIETPIVKAKVHRIAGKKLAVAPILRAGLGMVDGMVNMMPNVKVGHVGLYRDPETLAAGKVLLQACPLILLSATPSSWIPCWLPAAPPLRPSPSSKRPAQSTKLMSVIGAPEGVAKMQKDHPDVDIFIAALDDHLNENGYIVPGLGDAGDRIFRNEIRLRGNPRTVCADFLYSHERFPVAYITAVRATMALSRSGVSALPWSIYAGPRFWQGRPRIFQIRPPARLSPRRF